MPAVEVNIKFRYSELSRTHKGCVVYTVSTVDIDSAMRHNGFEHHSPVYLVVPGNKLSEQVKLVAFKTCHESETSGIYAEHRFCVQSRFFRRMYYSAVPANGYESRAAAKHLFLFEKFSRGICENFTISTIYCILR